MRLTTMAVVVLAGLAGCACHDQAKSPDASASSTVATKPSEANTVTPPKPSTAAVAVVKPVVVQPQQIDQVMPGDEAAEQRHNHQGQNDGTGDWTDKTYRDTPGGWFSWDLKVTPDQPNELWVTYAGVDKRTFNILVNGKMLSDKAQPGSDEDFYEQKYAIPSEMIGGKQTVTVRFASIGQNYAGGVFGIRTMRVAGSAAH